MVDSDSKYIVFKREDFTEMLRFQGMEHLAQNMLGDSEKIEIRTLSSYRARTISPLRPSTATPPPSPSQPS